MGKLAWRNLLGAALVALFAGHAAGWLPLPLLPRAEALLHDLRIRALAPGTPDDRIVVVDIDEKSLREKDRGGEGRWPWRRDRLAQLVSDLLGRYGVSMVALDIILSEQDRSSGLDVLEQLAQGELRDLPQFRQRLEQLRPALTFDRRLAQAMGQGPVVLGYAFHNDHPAAGTRLPEGWDPQAWGLARLPAQSYPGYSGLLPQLQAAAAGAGHLNPLRDPDGVIRRVPLLVEHDGRYYPSLSLTVTQLLVGEEKLSVDTARYGPDDLRIERLRFGPLEVPVDGSLNAIVPFRSGSHSFPYVSAVDVLQGRADPAQLQGRIVLIGTSAAGLADLVATPVGVSMPGVEVHANLITAMLDGRVPHTPAYAVGVEVLTIVALGLAMLWVGLRHRPGRTLLVFVLAAAAVMGLNLAALAHWQLLMPLATPLACLLALFVFDMSWGFFIESRGKRQMSALFAHYVPPELVEKMAQDPESFSMAPTERELTVLFSDIRNFTTISERLSPGELGEVINTVLSAQSEIIRNQFQGTLDKYIGDAVMAFWGAPVPAQDHARQAVLAAIEMVRAVREINETGRARGWPHLQIGVGLNTGRMRVGDMGSNVRRAYTVMGDAVNLASRLEGLTKLYGVDILVGENTRRAVDDWLWREVDRVRVKGKDQPVTLFEPITAAQEATPALHQELALWHQALAAYRSQAWEQALAHLQALAQTFPQRRLYAVYTDRVREFQQQPPPADWEGAIRTEK